MVGGATPNGCRPQLLLAGLLQAHCDELTVFQGVTHHPGFVDKLSRTMAELQQANREVPSLTIDRQQGHLKGREGNLKLDGALHGGESEVADKAHDLRLILNLYQTELDQRGLVDDSWCWREAARAIGKSGFWKAPRYGSMVFTNLKEQNFRSWRPCC